MGKIPGWGLKKGRKEERKIHKSRKICRENKGDTRRDKGSAKKSVGRYEEVCRQEEIGCR